jgi:hypothetical protein
MFRNAHSALGWAYETVTRPVVKMSGINHMREVPTRGIPNEVLVTLSASDRHKQAAQIIGMVERIAGQAEREYIRARFGRELDQDDIQVLVYRGCEALGLGLGGQVPVYRVMHSYFVGSNMPYRVIRRMLSCRDQHALMVKSCLYEVLDVIHDRAMADMTEIFEQHGLIQSTSSCV